jgi:hypothetical protein
MSERARELLANACGVPVESDTELDLYDRDQVFVSQAIAAIDAALQLPAEGENEIIERCAKVALKVGQCANTRGLDPSLEAIAEDIAEEILALKSPDHATGKEPDDAKP